MRNNKKHVLKVQKSTEAQKGKLGLKEQFNQQVQKGIVE